MSKKLLPKHFTGNTKVIHCYVTKVILLHNHFLSLNRHESRGRLLAICYHVEFLKHFFNCCLICSISLVITTFIIVFVGKMILMHRNRHLKQYYLIFLRNAGASVILMTIHVGKVTFGLRSYAHVCICKWYFYIVLWGNCVCLAGRWATANDIYFCLYAHRECRWRARFKTADKNPDSNRETEFLRDFGFIFVFRASRA